MVEMQLKNCAHIDEILLNISDWTLRLDFQIFAGGLFAATFAFGLISNVFVIATVIKYKNLLTNFCNEYVGNLASADLMICIISLPVTAYVDFYKVWPFGSIACRIIPCVQGICVLVSSFTLSVIAIDRYFRILRRERIDRRDSSAVVLVIWITACFIAVPLAINTDMKPGSLFHEPPLCEMFCTESEWEHPTYRKIYGTFLFVMQFVLPLAIIAGAYGVIACRFNAGTEAYKRANSEPSLSLQRRRSAFQRQRTYRMLVAMIITFAVASAPLALFNLLNDYGAIPEFLQRQKYFIFAVGHLCAALSTTIDPILYVIMNRKFSETVLRAIRCQLQQQMRKISTRSGLRNRILRLDRMNYNINR